MSDDKPLDMADMPQYSENQLTEIVKERTAKFRVKIKQLTNGLEAIANRSDDEYAKQLAKEMFDHLHDEVLEEDDNDLITVPVDKFNKQCKALWQYQDCIKDAIKEMFAYAVLLRAGQVILPAVIEGYRDNLRDKVKEINALWMDG